MRKSLAIFIITMVGILNLCVAGSVVLEAGTPVFDHPNANRTPINLLSRTVQIPVTQRKVYFLSGQLLLRYFDFYRIPVAPGKHVWATPGLKCVMNPQTRLYDKKLVISNPFWRKLLLGLIICGLAGIGTLFFYGRARQAQSGPFALSQPKLLFYGIAAVALLRWLILLSIIIGGGNILLFNSDEPSFFKVADDLSRLDFSGPWRMTIGFPLFLLPFVCASGAKNIYDILIPYSWFGGFVLMPGAMALFYLTIRKLTGSDLKAFVSALLWAVVPMFFFQWERHDLGFFKSYFALPELKMSFACYKSYTWAGFNAMSDTASTFVVMLTICLALYLKPRLRMIIVISALFAFACLVRINNIFFAPLVAWLFWVRFGRSLLEVKRLAAYLAAALGTFLIVFLPQLVFNHLQFGSIFDFPYVLHDKTTAGFEWSLLRRNIPIMVKSNLALWTPGIVGLLFVKERHLRITLTLLAIPMILFFLGYVWSHEHTTRFLLPTYGAMFAAVVCAGIWEQASGRQAILLALLMLASLLLVCPMDYNAAIEQLPWNLQDCSWGRNAVSILNWAIPAAGVLIALSFWKKWSLMYFTIMFMLLYFAFPPIIISTLFAILLARAIYDCYCEIIIRTNQTLN